MIPPWISLILILVASAINWTGWWFGRKQRIRAQRSMEKAQQALRKIENHVRQRQQSRWS